MSKPKSKWITFGEKLVVKRSNLVAVHLQSDKIDIMTDPYGNYTVFFKNVDSDEEESIRNDFYEYKGEIKYD